MTNAPINIILQKVGTPDDHLVITPDTDDGKLYNCTYKQNSINCCVTFTLTTDSIRRYLLLFFESVAEDNDGPEYVQFEVPTFPAAVFRAEDMPYLITTIVRQIEFLQDLDYWPLDSNPGLGKPIVSTGLA